MKIQEILDNEIPDLLYKTAWGWAGQFKWGEQLFTVQLSKTAPKGVPRWRIYEVSFFRADQTSDDAFSTQGGSEEVPIKVYSVVLNAARKAWRDHDMDALFFTAEPRHSKDQKQHERKERIYSFIAQRIFRGDGGFLYVRRGDGEHYPTEWLLTREELPPNDYWTNSLHEGLNQRPDGYEVKSI